MEFFVARNARINFTGGTSSGKTGEVTTDLTCENEAMGRNKDFDNLMMTFMSSQTDSSIRLMPARVGIILRSGIQGNDTIVVRLRSPPGSNNVLKEMRNLPGFKTATAEVTLSLLQQMSSTGEIIPPNIEIKTKEMTATYETWAVICEDRQLVLPVEWRDMFGRPGDDISARITIKVTVNFETIQESGTSQLAVFEKMLQDDRDKDVTIVAQNGRHVRCHKFMLVAYSPVFDAMLHADMSESKSLTVEIPDMTEEGVQSFLKYVYCQDKTDPNDESGIAFELLYGAHKYEVASDMEAVMREILLCKPAQWFEIDVALRLFQFARVLPDGNSLKIKAVQVLKSHVDTLQLSTTWKEMFQENPEATLELIRLVATSHP